MDLYINNETGAPVLVDETGNVYSMGDNLGFLPISQGQINQAIDFQNQAIANSNKGGFNKFIGKVTGLFKKADGSPTTFANVAGKVASNITFQDGKVSFTNNQGQQQFMTQGQFNQQFQQGGIPGSGGFNPLWILGGVAILGGIIWAVNR